VGIGSQPNPRGVERLNSALVRMNNTAISGGIVGAPNCISVFDFGNNPLTC
jgi:hypothetical protein